MSEYSDVQLFVRPISPDVKHEDIEEFFSQVGPIKELRLMPGYAFIEYETPELAQKAFSEYIDKSFQGESLQIEYAKRKPEYAKKGDFRAKITNLPEGTAWQDFKDFIRDEVRIHPTFVRIPPDEPTICYLEFGSKEDQDSAITQLNDIKYKDTELSAEQDNSPYIASASRQFNPRRRRRGGGGYRGGRGDYGGPRGDYDRPRGDYDRPRGDYGGPRGGYGGPRGGYGGPRGGYGGYRRGPPPPRDYGPPPAYDDAPGYRDYPPSGPRGSYPPRGGRGGYPPRSSGGYPPRGGSRDDYAAGDDRSFRDGPPPAPRGSDYRSSREGESGYPEEREYSRDRSPTRY